MFAIWKRQWGLVIKTAKVKNYAVIRTLINQLIILSWLMLLVSLLTDLGKVGLDQLNINYSPFFTFWAASSILSHTTFKKYYWNVLNWASSTKDGIGFMFQICSCFYLRLNYTELFYFNIIPRNTKIQVNCYLKKKPSDNIQTVKEKQLNFTKYNMRNQKNWSWI